MPGIKKSRLRELEVTTSGSQIVCTNIIAEKIKNVK